MHAPNNIENTNCEPFTRNAIEHENRLHENELWSERTTASRTTLQNTADF